MDLCQAPRVLLSATVLTFATQAHDHCNEAFVHPPFVGQDCVPRHLPCFVAYSTACRVLAQQGLIPLLGIPLSPPPSPSTAYRPRQTAVAQTRGCHTALRALIKLHSKEERKAAFLPCCSCCMVNASAIDVALRAGPWGGEFLRHDARHGAQACPVGQCGRDGRGASTTARRDRAGHKVRKRAQHTQFGSPADAKGQPHACADPPGQASRHHKADRDQASAHPRCHPSRRAPPDIACNPPCARRNAPTDMVTPHTVARLRTQSRIMLRAIVLRLTVGALLTPSNTSPTSTRAMRAIGGHGLRTRYGAPPKRLGSRSHGRRCQKGRGPVRGLGGSARHCASSGRRPWPGPLDHPSGMGGAMRPLGSADQEWLQMLRPISETIQPSRTGKLIFLGSNRSRAKTINTHLGQSDRAPTKN